MLHRSAVQDNPSSGSTLRRPGAGVGLPSVSVILPIRNEERHIEACLERLLTQDYPSERLEVLVVDGRSDDGTLEVVRLVQARHPEFDLRLLDNPERTVPPGLNAAIRASTGEVIIRMDGHTVPAADYVSACVAALRASGAANVGGVIEPVGTTPFGRAVALASAHRLGAGDAKYRVGGKPGYVDTGPFGAFRREVFERVGLFDESLVRNQDYELNVRIRASGERVYLDPAIRSAYTPRDGVPALWGQYFQYGWWKVETLRRHPRSLRWRQLVPPAFVVGLAILALAAPWSAPAAVAAALGAAAYLAVVVVTSWGLARELRQVARVALAFTVIHVAFGAGFITNLVSGGRFPYRAGRPRVPAFSTSVPGAVEVAP